VSYFNRQDAKYAKKLSIFLEQARIPGNLSGHILAELGSEE
jgi:hypothetical protein